MEQARQLLLDLLVPEPASFDNFLAGDNGELVAQLSEMLAGRAREMSIFLWGGAGVGKSHLLQAAVARARAGSRPASLIDASAEGALSEALVADGMVLAVDVSERMQDAHQAALFSFYNDLRARRGVLLVASREPLGALSLREDVRTRLGWGLVYEVRPLRDEAKPQALRAYARRRGLRLEDGVIQYLLQRSPRDLPTLVNTLAALDRYSLASRRPVTIPLLRELLLPPVL